MKSIPNIITCLNLFSGCLAVIIVLVYGNYIGALFFITLAAVFDFLDGFAARLLKAFSPIGADLDSLADVVSFGFAPSCVVFAYLQSIAPALPFGEQIAFTAFLITIFAALRLAKFNVDTRQTDSFLGLPVPANGLFWAAFIPAIIPYSQGNEVLFTIVTVVLMLVFSLLMVSEVPMFSFKIKKLNFKDNQLQIILAIATVFLIAFLGILGISLSILTYITLSVISHIIKPKA